MKKKKLFGFSVLSICLILLILGYYSIKPYISIPTTRLKAGEYYKEMPPDSKHIYLELPVDHNNPEKGSFTDFIILSPDYDPNKPIIFFLTDGQQAKVHPECSYYLFDQRLKDMSYVLIGRRGHFPTLFPEVYNENGKLNYNKALDLYGSKQFVEDIECVRRYLVRKKLIPENKKIMLYGRSGAGFLAQQYLNKYGKHVSRVILESTGAPDLADKIDSTFQAPLSEIYLAPCVSFLNIKNNPDFGFMISKIPYKEGIKYNPEKQIAEIKKLSEDKGFSYYKYWFKLPYNFLLVKKMMTLLPMNAAVFVRLYELTGMDLINYDKLPENIMYSWLNNMLSDYMERAKSGKIPIPSYAIDRRKFSGEVLVISGTMDHVFSIRMGQALRGNYKNSKFLVFNDNHELLRYPEYYKTLRTVFFYKGFNSKEFQKILNEKPDIKNCYNGAVRCYACTAPKKLNSETSR